ncbi:c-type cytochrome [Lysobacter sp. A421]
MPASILAATLLAVLLGPAVAQAQESPTSDSAPAESPAEAEAPSPDYLDLRRVASIHGDAAAGQAKSELCAACHGPQGIAIAPIFPNIAGQSADFMYWQLVEYKRGVNPSPMTPLVANLSDQDMRDLSMYYAAMPADGAPSSGQEAPAAAADPAQLQLGEQLYLSGDLGKGIPSCQGCHGADARGPAAADRVNRSGHHPYAGYPSLRGQQAAYLQAKLGAYRDGNIGDSTSDFVMTGVAKQLDDASIQALSTWLSSLPATDR